MGVALTLGLGIGATAAIFSVVDGVVLRSLPYAEADRLAAVGATFPTREWADEESSLQYLAGISMLNYRDFVRRTRSFERLAGLELTNALMPDRGDGPELVRAARVSIDFFEILGVSPVLGRTFLPVEERVSSDAVVLITHGAWQRRFGADPGIVGRPLGDVEGGSTIVGILPADFRAPEAFVPGMPEFWMPLQPEHERYASRGGRSLSILGRLAPEATVESAREEARAIAADLAGEFPEGNIYPDGSHIGIGINGLQAETVGRTGRTLRIFVGAAALLLLLSTMNSATLLLSRALDRTRELGVRVALGAGRVGVVRLLLVEALLLAAVGGVVGIAIAFAGVEGFVRLAPPSIPRLSEIAVDGRVLAVAVMITLGSGLAAGMLPAVRLGRAGKRFALDAGNRTAGEQGYRVRSVLVSAQVATALVLLSGGGLLVSSFGRIVTVEPGFEPEGVVTMNIALKRPGAPESDAWQGWDAALAELERVPGVTALAGTTNPPFQSPFWAPRMLLPDDGPEVRREGIAGYAITPGYLAAIGTEVVAGRGFDRSDGQGAEPVVIVNEAFVRTQLDGSDPLGLVLRQSEGDSESAMRIVGVVEDVVQASADEGPLPAVYLPYTQTDWPFMQAVVRSSVPAELLIPELRKAVARFNPVVPPRDVRTMRDRMAASRVSQFVRFARPCCGATPERVGRTHRAGSEECERDAARTTTGTGDGGRRADPGPRGEPVRESVARGFSLRCGAGRSVDAHSRVRPSGDGVCVGQPRAGTARHRGGPGGGPAGGVGSGYERSSALLSTRGHLRFEEEAHGPPVRIF
jgi:putative ABC transport system permease protein